jgi:hypothetical protein
MPTVFDTAYPRLKSHPTEREREIIQRLTNAQRLELLDTYPLFTSRCPACEMPIHQTEPSRIHWDCGHCGWMDESI